ncbi:TadE family type IV pilus minor pilin [Streptoalloteichus hindustanus]|uniref:TadE family type IV pilus minor pilin n=1 Tax=Streptoalloteichus hindustanus TaxID=2017 RepID=UPI000935D5C6|nr:TadE family type IV pilus minor pilin [Streptoalloteichus hindustanus]
MRRARRCGRGDRGAVTVEAAIGICTVVVVLALALAGITAVITQLRCTDAAREAARLVARGEATRATEAARHIVPRDADVEVHVEGETVRVEVSHQPTHLLPGVRVRAEAYAVLEPGATNEREAPK